MCSSIFLVECALDTSVQGQSGLLGQPELHIENLSQNPQNQTIKELACFLLSELQLFFKITIANLLPQTSKPTTLTAEECINIPPTFVYLSLGNRQTTEGDLPIQSGAKGRRGPFEGTFSRSLHGPLLSNSLCLTLTFSHTNMSAVSLPNFLLSILPHEISLCPCSLLCDPLLPLSGCVCSHFSSTPPPVSPTLIIRYLLRRGGGNYFKPHESLQVQ